MQIIVRCFASVREVLGQDRLELEVQDGTTVAGVRALLAARWPEFGRLRCACAVNRGYVPATRVLVAGDEVAFIPPISGG